MIHEGMNSEDCWPRMEECVLDQEEYVTYMQFYIQLGLDFSYFL